MTEEQAIYFTIIFMAFTYAAIGFGINKANAKYLLAGYNTMGTQKRSEFDIDAYLDFLKPFFKKLSLFPIVSFIALSFILNGETKIMIWSLVQIIPFAYFLRTHFKKFKNG